MSETKLTFIFIVLGIAAVTQCKGSCFSQPAVTIHACFTENNLTLPSSFHDSGAPGTTDDIIPYLVTYCNKSHQARAAISCVVAWAYDCLPQVVPALNKVMALLPSPQKIPDVVEVVCHEPERYLNLDQYCLLSEYNMLSACFNSRFQSLPFDNMLPSTVCGFYDSIANCSYSAFSPCRCSSNQLLVDIFRGPLFPPVCGQPGFPAVQCDTSDPSEYSGFVTGSPTVSPGNSSGTEQPLKKCPVDPLQTIYRCFTDNDLPPPVFNNTFDLRVYLQDIFPDCTRLSNQVPTALECSLDVVNNCASSFLPNVRSFSKFIPNLSKLTRAAHMLCNKQTYLADDQWCLSRYTSLPSCVMSKMTSPLTGTDSDVCNIFNAMTECVFSVFSPCSSCASMRVMTQVMREPIFPDVCGISTFPEIRCNPEDERLYENGEKPKIVTDPNPGTNDCHFSGTFGQSLTQCFVDNQLRLPINFESFNLQGLMEDFCSEPNVTVSTLRCVNDKQACYVKTKFPQMTGILAFLPSDKQLSKIVDLFCENSGVFASGQQCFAKNAEALGNCMGKLPVEELLQTNDGACKIGDKVVGCLYSSFYSCGCDTTRFLTDIARGPMYPAQCGKSSFKPVICDTKNPQKYAENASSGLSDNWTVILLSTVLVLFPGLLRL